jgi:Ion channel
VSASRVWDRPTPAAAPTAGRVGRPHARFATVLVLLLGLLFWLVGGGAPQNARLQFELTVGVVLLSAILTASDAMRWRRAVTLLGVPAVLLCATWIVASSPVREHVPPGAVIVFSAYATVRSLGAVLRSQRVTGDVLAGALATYVMAGLSFAIVYGVLEAGAPGAFHVANGRTAFPDLVYFSFVTLLTVGFGDVTPALPLARAVAVFEGLFGVVYTTVVMAALVAAYLEGRRA